MALIRPRGHQAPAATLARVICLLLLLGLAAGCASKVGEEELTTRLALDTVARSLRPGGGKPVLPALAKDAPPESFLRYALLNSPEVAAAYFDWYGAAEKASSAGTPPDPRLTFQMDITSIVSSLMPGLMLDFPPPGQLAAEKALASAEGRRSYFNFKKAVLQTAFAVKKEGYELQFIERKLALNREILGLLGEIQHLAEIRSLSGQGMLLDVLRAQREEDSLAATIGNLEDARELAGKRFKGALGLGPDQADPPLPATWFPTAPLALDADTLLQEAMARNPQLMALQAEIQQADAGITLAEKAGLPSFSAGIESDVKAVPVMWRPQLSATLPVWKDRIAAEIRSAQAGKQARTERLSSEQIALAVDFAEKRFLIRESARNLRLVEEKLLPKARQGVELAKSAYAAGTIDFPRLLEESRSLLELQVMEAEARMQQDVALAEISLLILGRAPADAPLADGVLERAQPGPAKERK